MENLLQPLLLLLLQPLRKLSVRCSKESFVDVEGGRESERTAPWTELMLPQHECHAIGNTKVNFLDAFC